MVMFISVIEFNAMLPDNCTCYLLCIKSLMKCIILRLSCFLMLMGTLKCLLFWDRGEHSHNHHQAVSCI